MPTNSIKETISAHDEGEDLPRMGAAFNPDVDNETTFEVAADIQKLIASAPDRIWLDLGENLESLSDDATFRDLREVTWSEDNATGCGIKYVRAPLAPFLSIDFKQADALLSMFGGEPCEVTLSIAEGRSGRGLYAHYTEYPEEGAEFLGVTDGEAAPAAALAQPAPVQSGWQVVPVEPTDDMLYEIQENAHILPPRGKRIWKMLLKAAPVQQDAPAPSMACKGKNCGTTTGDHSPECVAEHEAAYSSGGQLDTPGNRNPESRYRGYKGEPLGDSASDDQRAAWDEGRRAAVPATSPAPSMVGDAKGGA